MEAWKDTATEDALMNVYARGGIIGGTSAGAAILGEVAFSAAQGTVFSDEVLLDPYDPRVTLERDFLSFSPLAGVMTDSHFAARDRFGRLMGFMARTVRDGTWTEARGLGIDEATALVVDAAGSGPAVGTVVGAGSVYALRGDAPLQCEPGLPLDYEVVSRRLQAGDTIELPAGTAAAPPQSVTAHAGGIFPSDPY
ncbi:MAG: hypothetical protein AAGN82_21970 [Myxococcota bacterium]